MMKFEETSKDGLRRGARLTVPQAEVAKAETTRLQEIAKKAKIQGFRPGKAPLNLIRQRFGAEVAGEVIEKLAQDGIDKLLADKAWRPARQPKVDLESSGEGKDLVFKVELELLPEIKAPDFSKISIEKPVADVADKTIDEAVDRLAKNFKEPVAIEEKRAAQNGDIVEISFDGTVDGVAQPGMKSDNHRVELGSGSLIDTFEAQIEGLKVGGKKDVKVTFPEDYHAKNLAGKKAVFAVELKMILAHPKVERNDALAKEIGFPSMEKLRERIASDIGSNYAKISRVVVKRALMDQLAEKCDFPLPATMVEAEFSSIWQQIVKDKAEGRLEAEDAKKSEAELKKEYEDIAQRRVRLGLLLADIAEKNKIEVAPAELRQAMIAEARRFPGQEKAVVDYYTKTRGAIEQLRAPILEEKVVDFILEKTKVSEKKMDADKLLALPAEMD